MIFSITIVLNSGWEFGVIIQVMDTKILEVLFSKGMCYSHRVKGVPAASWWLRRLSSEAQGLGVSGSDTQHQVDAQCRPKHGTCKNCLCPALQRTTPRCSWLGLHKHLKIDTGENKIKRNKAKLILFYLVDFQQLKLVTYTDSFGVRRGFILILSVFRNRGGRAAGLRGVCDVGLLAEGAVVTAVPPVHRLIQEGG